MINFLNLLNIVPLNGSLVLTITRSDDGLTVIYAPKFKGKEQDNTFRPLCLKGTPEELNTMFEPAINDISLKQRTLADDFKERAKELDKKLLAKKDDKQKPVAGSKAVQQPSLTDALDTAASGGDDEEEEDEPGTEGGDKATSASETPTETKLFS